MKWWPLFFRSTHAAELAQVRADFARNLAERDKVQSALEDSLRYYKSRAELLDHQVRAARCQTQESMAHTLGVSAAIHAAAGKPVCQIAAFRADPASPTASVLALLAGPITDADIRRFLEFNGGFAQDMVPSERLVSKINKLAPEDPK